MACMKTITVNVSEPVYREFGLTGHDPSRARGR